MSASAAARSARRRSSSPSCRFSATVSSVITPWPSGTCATPARLTSSGRRPVRSVLSSLIRPWLSLSDPSIARRRVVLPAPLAPSTAVIVPAGAVTDTSRSTVTAPYPPQTPVTCSDAGLLMQDSQVGLGDERIGLNFRRAALGDQDAEVEHENVVADRHHQV